MRMAAHPISLLPESLYMSQPQANLLAWHLPAHNTPYTNLQVTLDVQAVAQNHTQPPHLCQNLGVLGHEDGSTPHLTVAGVIAHVLTTSPVVGMASTRPQHTLHARQRTDGCE